MVVISDLWIFPVIHSLTVCRVQRAEETWEINSAPDSDFIGFFFPNTFEYIIHGRLNYWKMLSLTYHKNTVNTIVMLSHNKYRALRYERDFSQLDDKQTRKVDIVCALWYLRRTLARRWPVHWKTQNRSAMQKITEEQGTMSKSMSSKSLASDNFYFR